VCASTGECVCACLCVFKYMCVCVCVKKKECTNMRASERARNVRHVSPFALCLCRFGSRFRSLSIVLAHSCSRLLLLSLRALLCMRAWPRSLAHSLAFALSPPPDLSPLLSSLSRLPLTPSLSYHQQHQRLWHRAGRKSSAGYIPTFLVLSHSEILLVLPWFSCNIRLILPAQKHRYTDTKTHTHVHMQSNTHKKTQTYVVFVRSCYTVCIQQWQVRWSPCMHAGLDHLYIICTQKSSILILVLKLWKIYTNAH